MTSCIFHSVFHLSYATPQALPSDPRILALAEKVPAELWGVRLALQLLHEKVKGPESAYAPYVDMLPQGLAAPMFFKKESIDALEYAPIQEMVRWYSSFLLRWMTLPSALGARRDLFTLKRF